MHTRQKNDGTSPDRRRSPGVYRLSQARGASTGCPAFLNVGHAA